jgi:tripartite-type tricarboxylate transporter receptor subunit TctC
MQLRFGSGSGPHLSMALLEKAVDIRLQHVQYKDSPQQLAALISGEVQVAFDTVASAVPRPRLAE